jgi:hypothetical protein
MANPMRYLRISTIRIIFSTALILLLMQIKCTAQDLRKWEFRATGEWNIRTIQEEYSYNMMFGIGAQIERYFGRWFRANAFSAVHRSFPNEPGGSVYVRRLSFGGAILIMDRQRFPVGLQIGTGWNYYWARFPEVEVNNLVFKKRTDAFMYPMLFIGAMARINNSIEAFANYCSDTLYLFQTYNSKMIQLGIRYRWAKGKPDPVGEEK